jgi:3-methyl-2-oxobutanoate hydroxymethyltransferase
MKIHDFSLKKQKGQKISMLTCYDYSFARIMADSEVDCLLVGDSLSMVMHGHSTTLNATVDLMALHTAAVSRGAANKFIVGDMPFLSFRKGLNSNMAAVGKIMRAGANAVKLEGAKGNLELVRHVVDSGVPVMGHLGLTPQSVNQLGGFKVQGKAPKEHNEILKDALALEKAGCFSLVLECVPADLAVEVSKALKIPTIGIGAGVGCDGQVLVLQDMLGMNKDFHPKFLRTYFNGVEALKKAFNDYHRDVVTEKFPSKEESY